MYLTFYDVIKSSLNEIGLTVDELQTFEQITSEPRPLMYINEIRTKNNRERLLVMGHLPPKYESHQPLGFLLRVVTNHF